MLVRFAVLRIDADHHNLQHPHRALAWRASLAHLGVTVIQGRRRPQNGFVTIRMMITTITPVVTRLYHRVRRAIRA